MTRQHRIDVDDIYGTGLCPVCGQFRARHDTGVCEWCAPVVVARRQRAVELIDELERAYPGYGAWLRWAEVNLPGKSRQ